MSTYKVFIGVGHGGSDPGACGNGLKESDINLMIAKSLSDELIKNGVTVKMSRETDENDPINQEIIECNAFKPDIAIDVHTNAGGGKGFEVLHQTNAYKIKSIELSQIIENEVLKIGQNSRGLKTRLGTTGLDYFGFLRSCKCVSIITECAFIDRTEDVALINSEEKCKKFGVAYAMGILEFLKIKKDVITVEEVNETVGNMLEKAEFTKIDGESVASVSQMKKYLSDKNPKVFDEFGNLAEMYFTEGEKENIRGDIAFAQACLETGFFTFGGDVLASQNNFCGLGAVGNGEMGESFSTPLEGAKAQIQHLKAYANNDELNEICADPRFKYVQRGVAPYVEYLGINENPSKKGWATDVGYGSKILALLNDILKIDDTKEVGSLEEKNDVVNSENKVNDIPNWAEKGVEWAVENSVLVGDENGDLMLDKTLTRMEMCVMMERVFNK